MSSAQERAAEVIAADGLGPNVTGRLVRALAAAGLLVDDDTARLVERFQHLAGVGDAVWDADLDCQVAATAHGLLLYVLTGDVEGDDSPLSARLPVGNPSDGPVVPPEPSRGDVGAATTRALDAALWIDPSRLGGKVAITGTRLSAEHAAHHFLAGYTLAEYRDWYGLDESFDRRVLVAVAWWVLHEKRVRRDDRATKKAWADWATRTWRDAWNTITPTKLTQPPAPVSGGAG